MNDEICQSDAYGFVYITINHINGHKYIGKCKYDVAGKWKKYLGSGKLLRRAIKKYGYQNFSKRIIEEANTFEELDRKEKYWIDFYDAVPSRDYYNLAAGGTGGNTKIGYTKDDYIRSEQKRLSAIRRAIVLRRGERVASSKLRTSQVLEIIECFKQRCTSVDIRKMAEQYNVAPSTIQDIYSHRTWTFLTNGINFPPIDVSHWHRNAFHKPVVAYDMDMNCVGTFNSAREAGNVLNVNYKLISRVCRGERPHTKGYIFKFVDNQAA